MTTNNNNNQDEKTKKEPSRFNQNDDPADKPLVYQRAEISRLLPRDQRILDTNPYHFWSITETTLTPSGLLSSYWMIVDFLTVPGALARNSDGALNWPGIIGRFFLHALLADGNIDPIKSPTYSGMTNGLNTQYDAYPTMITRIMGEVEEQEKKKKTPNAVESEHKPNPTWRTFDKAIWTNYIPTLLWSFGNYYFYSGNEGEVKRELRNAVGWVLRNYNKRLHQRQKPQKDGHSASDSVTSASRNHHETGSNSSSGGTQGTASGFSNAASIRELELQGRVENLESLLAREQEHNRHLNTHLSDAQSNTRLAQTTTKAVVDIVNNPNDFFAQLVLGKLTITSSEAASGSSVRISVVEENADNNNNSNNHASTSASSSTASAATKESWEDDDYDGVDLGADKKQKEKTPVATPLSSSANPNSKKVPAPTTAAPKKDWAKECCKDDDDEEDDRKEEQQPAAINNSNTHQGNQNGSGNRNGHSRQQWKKPSNNNGGDSDAAGKKAQVYKNVSTTSATGSSKRQDPNDRRFGAWTTSSSSNSNNNNGGYRNSGNGQGGKGFNNHSGGSGSNSGDQSNN